MQVVFYLNTNIWANNQENPVVREEVTLATRSPGRALGSEWWGSTWWQSLQDDERAGGQSLTLLSAFAQLKVSYSRSFINLVFWIQMVCVSCQGHGGLYTPEIIIEDFFLKRERLFLKLIGGYLLIAWNCMLCEKDHRL